jgi:hypothetical protein
MTIMPRIQAMPFLQAALILFVLDIILEGRGGAMIPILRREKPGTENRHDQCLKVVSDSRATMQSSDTPNVRKEEKQERR